MFTAEHIEMNKESYIAFDIVDLKCTIVDKDSTPYLFGQSPSKLATI